MWFVPPLNSCPPKPSNSPATEHGAEGSWPWEGLGWQLVGSDRTGLWSAHQDTLKPGPKRTHADADAGRACALSRRMCTVMQTTQTLAENKVQATANVKHVCFLGLCWIVLCFCPQPRPWLHLRERLPSTYLLTWHLFCCWLTRLQVVQKVEIIEMERFFFHWSS